MIPQPKALKTKAEVSQKSKKENQNNTERSVFS